MERERTRVECCHFAGVGKVVMGISGLMKKRGSNGRPGVLLLLPLAALVFATEVRAGGCAEENEVCVENCSIEFGMEEGRQKLFKCLKRCGSRNTDCRDLRTTEKQPSRGGRGEPSFDVPRPRRPAESDLPPVPLREVEDEEPVRWQPEQGADESRVRIEGPREVVMALADVFGIELLLHGARQLSNDRLSVVAIASEEAIATAKARGCEVSLILPSADEAPKGRESEAPRRIEPPGHGTSKPPGTKNHEGRLNDDFDRGGE